MAKRRQRTAAGSKAKRVRVVVTAGPTREHLDDVRFLSNGSTGAMGIELARAARARGADVTLVLGPTHLAPPLGVKTVHVTTTDEMLSATRRAARGANLIFFAAAPADWKPTVRNPGKPGKGRARTLRLTPTPDIAALLGRSKGRRVHVGFALEAGAGGEARARRKLFAKRFDAIVLNSPANLGSGGGEAGWIAQGRKPVSLATSSKIALARRVYSLAWSIR